MVHRRETAETVVTDPYSSQAITIQARTNSYALTAVTAKAGVPTTLAITTVGTAGRVRVFVTALCFRRRR